MPTRFRFVAILAAVTMVVAACGPGEEEPGLGPGDSPQPGESPDPGQPGDLSGDLFAFGFTCTTGDIIATTRFDYFTEQYPDITVTCSEGDFGGQEFLAALQAADRPDVVNVPRNVIGTYIDRGVLQPLDDCISQEGIDTGNYYDAAINQVTVDGTVYALPEFFNTRVWIINDAAFEEAGLDPETFDFSDWDAIAEANEALMQANGGVQRIGIDPKVPEFLEMWVRANGGQSISDDGLTSQMDTPEVIEAVEFTVSLIEAHGPTSGFFDFRDTWDFFGADNQVAADQIGAWPMEQWYLNVLAGNSPDTEITVRPFETRDGDVITLADGNSWAIVEGTDNYEAACAFIATMVHEDTWIAAAEARAEQRAEEGQPNTGVYTANRAADDVIFNEIVDLSEWPQFDEAVRIVVENQEDAFGFPPSPAGQEFLQARDEAVSRVTTGEDAAQALQEANAEAQQAIDAAGP